MTKQLLTLAYVVGTLLTLQSCRPITTYAGDQSGPGGLTASVERPKSAAELRAELLIQEQHSPEDYLQVEATYHRNFINQLVLEGDIASTATLATYKDPVLAVTWVSKTDTELETVKYPVYELVRSQGSTHFKLKTSAPGYVASVRVGIAGATPVE
jgi:hypothetical protein